MEKKTGIDLIQKTMRAVFAVSDNIISPLGSGTAENFIQLSKGVSGIRKQEYPEICSEPFYASLFTGKDHFLSGRDAGQYTRFEQLLIASINGALQNSGIDPGDSKTVFILSSTKGNIALLETQPIDESLKERIALHTSAKLISGYFHFANPPVVISHACISGLLAIITAMRMLQSGQYDNAIVAGADLISRFVFSGFRSFQAVSPGPCRPFDAGRNGISLGEAAGTLILSSSKNHSSIPIRICSGSVSNDANHISGPSRTGEELCQAIHKAMQDAAVPANDIDFISAHGTATVYNDEMEAKALTLAGLQSVPVNSLKGYYGHTLGAAGLIESIVSIESLKKNTILPTLGFHELGTTMPLNVCSTLQTGDFKKCLKTASGFGGCNAAVVMSRE
jgi:3-oxoacyl-[acyl-carrier-protein] synthase-1